MFTTADIAASVEDFNTLNKGILIYTSKKIQNFEVDDVNWDETDHIEAEVEGHGRRHYGVYANINRYTGECEGIDCECPAFYTYNGICKHCVAVLLKYIDYCKARDMVEKKSAAGKKKAKPQAIVTSPTISMLLKKKADERLLPILGQDVYGKVHLEPLLHCTSAGVYLEAKIGITQMYVVKDIFEMVRLIEQRSNHRYGKKLEFVHTMEAFDEASKPIVRFFQNWAKDNEKRYRQQSSYGYYSNYYHSAAAKTREADLPTLYIGEYMETVRDRIFTAYVQGNNCEQWQLTDEPVRRHLKLTGERDGLSIQEDDALRQGIVSEKNYYWFIDGKVHVESFESIQPVREFAEAMINSPEDKLYIGKSDLILFCRELLPVLEKYYECEIIDFDKDAYGVPKPDFSIYLDAPQENMITCKAYAQYGDKKYALYDQKDLSLRDIESEKELRSLLREYSNAFDEKTGSVTAIDDDEVIYGLLVYGIPRMQAVAEVFVSDAIKKMEVKPAPKVTVGVSIESGLMELTLDSGEMPKDELLDILSRYNRKKKFYRLKDGSFINAENSALGDIKELKEGLQLTDAQLLDNQITLEKYRALYVDAQLKDSPLVSTVRGKSFRELIRNMRTVEDNDFEIPGSLAGTLREYQKTGFMWLKTLKYNGFGGILADDMGLGKTLQMIAFLLSEYQENPVYGRTLIVTPASLVFNWYEEFQKFAPSLPVQMVIGTADQRKQIIDDVCDNEILVTSYDLIKRDIKQYEKQSFAVQVIDEAQYIKNANTQAAKAVKTVKASFKLALTGTPVENRLSELWSIFDYLMPGFLYNYKKFRDELESPIVQNQSENASERLRKMIHPFVLRRLKKDVLTDLPDKLEENMYAQMVSEQKKLYDAHVQRLKILLDKQSDEEFKSSKIVVLSELTKLRQLCCDPSLLYEDYKGESTKKDMCITLIQNAVENGHKILLFSQFTTMLDGLAEALHKSGISYYMLTGATSKEKRRQLVNAFNQDDTSVFCISLKAGGTGLNLTAADVVIHYDPWWNVAAQNQATDRAHRIGQAHIVNVYKLIVKGSIEENILKMQDKKRELADQILNGEDIGSGSFTREELMEILA